MAKKRRKQTGPPGTPYPGPRRGIPQSGRYGPIDTRSFEQHFSDIFEGIRRSQAAKVKRTKPKPGTSV